MAFRDHGSLCICEECGAVFPNRGGCHRCRHTCDGGPIYKISSADLESLRLDGEKLGWDFNTVVRYSKALKRWVAAGRPTRTDEEVAAVEQTCKACKEYASREGRCRVCKCKILTPGITILSKAKLATETCPLTKW